ncbi:LytTR family DNA-binding domain-containing protein [Vagococcus sp.]|uniref:LytTR family DNA-binding domain-containing protein n=1 Tax=Vagococcus sp. TaxID=1933889 RepID=UPI003F9BA57F
MKLRINHIWNDLKSENEIDLVSHSVNKETIQKIENYLNKETQIKVVEIKNNRNVFINLSDIEVILSLGHMSQVLTMEGKIYYLNKRLKELSFLEDGFLCRINQSTILNLEEIIEFNVEQYSRLEVMTKSKNKYLISRHYAKNIKERLLWQKH